MAKLVNPKSQSQLLKNQLDPNPNEELLEAIKDKVEYHCVDYHKSVPIDNCNPKNKPHKTKCPTHLNNKDGQLTKWLREGLKRKAVSKSKSQEGHPKKIWYYDSESNQLYMAVFTQTSQGKLYYHGFPYDVGTPPKVIKELFI